uniref:hypothetical protein n=1 Tax=Mesorhizobium caraganae TaxID=483206 RepID=UPI0035E3C64F
MSTRPTSRCVENGCIFTAPSTAWATRSERRSSCRTAATTRTFPSSRSWSPWGGAVGADQPIITLESDKATLEVPSPLRHDQVALFQGDRADRRRRDRGRGPGDLIGEVGMAIEMGADGQDIGKTIHPHPTFIETVGMAAAEVMLGTCTDLLQSHPRSSLECEPVLGAHPDIHT